MLSQDKHNHARDYEKKEIIIAASKENTRGLSQGSVTLNSKVRLILS